MDVIGFPSRGFGDYSVFGCLWFEDCRLLEYRILRLQGSWVLQYIEFLGIGFSGYKEFWSIGCGRHRVLYGLEFEGYRL